MWINFLVIFLQFISGSIMYSYILANILKVDLSKVRDGNPGASNLWRAVGWKWGVLALILDYLKGAFPISLFVALGIVKNNYIIALSCLAGILGHAFSPMLNFKGGKAVAVSFGAWSVLTKWEAPTILGTVFTIFTIFKPKGTTVEEDAFRVLIGFLVLLPYVLYKFYLGYHPILLLYVGNLIVILYKHWKDLRNYFNTMF
ncbi:MAG: glycerol-3-phosphate acyltransferase [Dictyoglomus sp.]|nr:glycerol-3-phosphate acyltransferase [Dictyoglomus sp.]MCX7942497.1 glycerol-3-phosphate acyltransferase [Dictyoglomaceae bacterium]MDW8188913.1 glycerol-3-phosphate acyltransferase [Dictyoglomus sp.]